MNANLQTKIIVAMLSVALLTMDNAAHAQNNTNALSSDELRVLRDFIYQGIRCQFEKNGAHRY